MHRSHLIRLYPNEQQKVMLAKTAGTARYCYNWGLAKWNEMYKNGQSCNQYLLSRIWTKERPDWAKEVSRQAQTKALLNLGGAFTAFYQKKKKHPVFHKKGRKDSFYADVAHSRLVGEKKIMLSKIGIVRMAEKLRFEGKVKRFVVSRKADQWYVGITVELVTPIEKTKSTSAIGIDVGSRHWATTSEHEFFDTPKSLIRVRKHQKYLERRLSRKQKGSKNREKARIRLARNYKRQRDIKVDAVHKFTARIAKNHGIVCCENLNVASMMRIKGTIGKAVVNSCMGMLRLQLSYKAANYIEVAYHFPSTKQCSRCGSKYKIELRHETYTCPTCGLKINRDYNAAINLKNEGLRIFTEGHSGIACGER